MCEIKTVLIVAALLLAVTGFCIYQVSPRVGHNSEIKSESPCQKEYEKYCLSGGECYYLDDEDIVTLWIVTVHGYMEEIDVKITCGGLR